MAVWCFFSGITKSYEITPVLFNIIQNYTVVLNLTCVLILFDSSAPVHWPQRRIYWPTWTSCIHNLIYMCWLHMNKNVVDATHLISHDIYLSLDACEPYHSHVQLHFTWTKIYNQSVVDVTRLYISRCRFTLRCPWAVSLTSLNNNVQLWQCKTFIQ